MVMEYVEKRKLVQFSNEQQKQMWWSENVLGAIVRRLGTKRTNVVTPMKVNACPVLKDLLCGPFIKKEGGWVVNSSFVRLLFLVMPCVISKNGWEGKVGKEYMVEKKNEQ
eukprot:CAMPEP_0172452690 /NCGR_PEP_ID=MMETSP1065-20121228/10269_1 /TAXON_ID=265537 /ORGANISM="Amphiprora paludosa, Strain CCMP125" /LENGTH=109 /DNA_ID=CAMNT_0013204791 /DNA_START=1234 /DNA_END=1563 /DNA_ORIENTATION=+